jgi:hypothetical protein
VWFSPMVVLILSTLRILNFFLLLRVKGIDCGTQFRFVGEETQGTEPANSDRSGSCPHRWRVKGPGPRRPV